MEIKFIILVALGFLIGYSIFKTTIYLINKFRWKNYSRRVIEWETNNKY